jgi:hypothetical protein
LRRVKDIDKEIIFVDTNLASDITGLADFILQLLCSTPTGANGDPTAGFTILDASVSVGTGIAGI